MATTMPAGISLRMLRRLIAVKQQKTSAGARYDAMKLYTTGNPVQVSAYEPEVE
jgi:hypothetical protein